MLFTPGPTEMDEEIARIGMRPLPYFRGRDYCEHVLAMTEDLKYLFRTATTPLTVTASGTAGMEMALVNLFGPGDRVVSIDGGTFGAKWGGMARALGLEVHEVAVPHGRHPDLARIDAAVTPQTKGLLLTAHETSTGYLFDIRAIIAALRNKDCFVVVDGVSSIGADEFAMDEWCCDCAIASSQKALACMPGLVFVAFSERAQRRLAATRHYRSYLDARVYYENIVRGMLPFTPAMHATYQIAQMLARIRQRGLVNHVADIAAKAAAFRRDVCAAEGFALFPERPSNALSAIRLPAGVVASQLAKTMEQKYGAILPLNPTRAEDFLRVSHMGNLETAALTELARRIVAETQVRRG